MMTNLGDFDSSVGFLLHDTARQLRARFDARARDIGVTRQQWRVLALVDRLDGPTQSELAERLDVERITLCRMIDRLGDAGFVERRADPADRRVWRLYLLPAARPIAQRMAVIAAEMEAETVALLGDRAGPLREDLVRLRAHLGAEDKARAA